MSSHPKWPWITLCILQTVQVLTLLPWVVMAGLAVMAFDAPGSDKMWQPWAFVLTVWSYPVWLILAAVASWVLFSFRKYKSAVVVCVMFTLPVPLILFVMLAAGASA